MGKIMSNKIDQEVGSLKATLDALTDEEVVIQSGVKLKIHHLGGNKSNKLVIGTTAKGKSFGDKLQETQEKP